jgi:hypothetical protein
MLKSAEHLTVTLVHLPDLLLVGAALLGIEEGVICPDPLDPREPLHPAFPRSVCRGLLMGHPGPPEAGLPMLLNRFDKGPSVRGQIAVVAEGVIRAGGFPGLSHPRRQFLKVRRHLGPLALGPREARDLLTDLLVDQLMDRVTPRPPQGVTPRPPQG